MDREVLLLHLRRSPARYLWWVVPVSLAVVAPGALTHNLRLWGELPSAIGYTVVLLGPLAAGIVAWEAARERVEGTAEALAPMPTGGAARLGARALAAVLILVIAYLLSSLVIAGWYLVDGARGTAGWGPMALGAVGLLTWAAFGALVGTAWPWRWTPAVVAVAVYFGQAFLSAWWPQLMPFEDGGSAFTPYSTSHPRVVILTTFDRSQLVYDALLAGATGFLLKDVPRERLIGGIRAAARGEELLAPRITRRLIAEFTRTRLTPPPGVDRLTDREREIWLLMARGKSNAEIAAELYLGVETVKTHVARVLSKMELRDRVQAVVVAYESGLIRPGDEQ